MRHSRLASRRLACAALALALLSGCASGLREPTVADTEASHWRGRLSLNVDSEPPQSFSAAFDLSGSAQAGELSLSSPLGSTLAVMQWAPGQALLRQGEQTRHYHSIEQLAAEVTGTPLPVQALFGWLHGQPQAVPGWQADLSRLSDGRLIARRSMPLPTAELRVVLDH
ncbi:MAG: lipoprotein insertase outer membrane protein LolB [Pseudomonadota bacterium]|nr:lipoprotein insertase outer membrane protein LolB [Pseudomonadota bacterium]